jgi:polyisoprenyl-teichoic acid--peptidoglycan teichoic acid transferase
MADRQGWDPSPPAPRARRPAERSQARRVQPDSGPSDVRRLVAATASSIVPGAGQALNLRLRPSLFFGLPTLLIVLVAWLIAHVDRPSAVLARLLSPDILGVLLLLNIVVLGWRLSALFQAFTDHRYPGKPGRLGGIGLAALLGFTVVPHVVAWNAGTAAQQMFASIFAGSSVRSVSGTPQPADPGRLNVLLIGVDSGPGRTEALTDSLIVVSLDPVGRTVSMLSIPRDLAGVPLGNGSTYAPKINSLMSFAQRHPTQFPAGGVRTLEGAVEALLGIPIHAYATVDLSGFVAMVDAVGGVDVDVPKALADPNYPGLDGHRGWSVLPGPHHFNGTDALAYARIRKALGESDLTRAARQQAILVALRNRAVDAGILVNLPALLRAVGNTVRTDLPQSRLPELAALATEIGGASTVKVILTAPMIKSGGSSKYGSIWLPVPSRIAAMTRVVFGPPGANPTWPVPKPSAAVGASGSPAASVSP